MSEAFACLHLIFFLLFVFGFGTPCGPGKYLKGQDCLPCSSMCIQCTDINNCTKCEPNKALFQHKCIDSCPPHFQSFYSKDLQNFVCLEQVRNISWDHPTVLIPFKQIKNVLEPKS